MEIIVAYFVRNNDNAYTAARKTSPIDAIEGIDTIDAIEGIDTIDTIEGDRYYIIDEIEG